MSDPKRFQPVTGISRQIFIISIITALAAGFVGGTVYSSFKLAGQAAGPAMPQAGSPPQDHDHMAELAESIKALETHVKTNQDDADAWIRLGNLYYDTAQHLKSIEAYKKSLTLRPGTPELLTDLGVMYRRSSQPEKAIEMFDKVIQAFPEFEPARFNKGIVLMHDLKNGEAAIKAWQELLKINPLAVTGRGEPLESMIKRMQVRVKQEQ